MKRFVWTATLGGCLLWTCLLSPALSASARTSFESVAGASEALPRATATDPAPYRLAIELKYRASLGHYVDLAIRLVGADTAAGKGLGGFDLLVGFDYSLLAFQHATQGNLYAQCEWEYFTYHASRPGGCDTTCPSGLVQIIGMAETNNGPHNAVCDIAVLPVTMASIRFLVTRDHTWECFFVPVRFFWGDCGDNILANASGDESYVSAGVFDYYDGFTYPRVDNDTVGFPTWQGAQRDCLTAPGPTREVDFYNGGIDIDCDEIDARGDMDLDGIPFTLSDFAMYASYFVEGLEAFGPYVEGTIAASDCNADGIPTTIADFVFMTRVLTEDATAHPHHSPVVVGYSYVDGVMSVDTAVAAAHVVFGGSVTPALLAGNMKMTIGEHDGQTHVLVYSDEINQVFCGDFLRVNGPLVRLEVATYDGWCQVTAKAHEIPDSYALRQNYPNPFNPATTIVYELPKACDVTLEVFNLTGQHVATLVSGHEEAGEHTARWDGSGFASGVYVYRLQAGVYSETRKMVLLK